ncbi:MAG: SurA N-terminal domain-containing protein [Hymenobacteraceae bacterium]|nr:SurA N-terminal domain-containing protein [Hymenobacteraceae bacterium]
MALINKIREKSGWAIGAIALGMLMFIVAGDLFGSQSRFFSGRDTTVGKIAGQDVDYREFEAEVEKAKVNFANQQGHQPNDQEAANLRDQTWGALVNRKMLDKQFADLGLLVSDKELKDLVQGPNPHPAIKQAFTDPKTGVFDRAKVKEYLRNLDKAPQEQQLAWTEFERNLGPDRMRAKYEALLKMSSYVTKFEAEQLKQEQAQTASAQILFVPYFTVADSLLKVTDAQITDYIARHRDRFKVEDGRTIEYVTIPVTASKDDSATVRQEAAALTQQFKTTQNDSLFVMANSDQPYSGAFVGLGDLPQELRKSGTPTVGEVYGPYALNGGLQLIKVAAEKTGTSPAARASHILIKAAAQTPEAEAEAKQKAQDLINRINKGEDFAVLAAQFGTDGTASQGGDLGYFTKGRMVPEFETAIFGAKSLGTLPAPVKTQFGYHVIKITALPDARTYQLATVQKSIQPSDVTHESAYTRAQQLRASAADRAALVAAIAKDKTLTKLEAKDVPSSSRSVNNLQNARELVRWAYNEDTKLGTVSDPMEIDNQFIIATLTGKREKGYATAENSRDQVAIEVRKELKGKLIADKLATAKGATLADIAAKYGPTAQVKQVPTVQFNNPSIPGVGYEPAAVGSLFGLKPGKRSGTITGEQGVMIVQLENLTSVPAEQGVKQLPLLRKQVAQQRQDRAQNSLYQALQEKADIQDSRVKFY